MILYEINLAHEDILQSIEASLESDFLSITDPLSKNFKLNKNEHFRLIATQNIADKLFLNKRTQLSKKFFSKFHEIIFPKISSEEIIFISQELSKN